MIVFSGCKYRLECYIVFLSLKGVFMQISKIFSWKSLCIITFLFALAVNAQQDYSRNVVRNGNQVYLTGFKPMLQKGKTCSFYSTSMILAYYGVNVSPDKLKRRGNNIYSNNPKGSLFMAQRLKSLGFVFIIIQHNKRDELFREIVKYAIDNGIPLRWGVNMRYSPIKRDRGNSFHARIITGYIADKDKITHIFYSDSWGEKHINKLMTYKNALRMTTRYGPIFPKKNNDKFVSDFNAMIEQFTPPKKQVQSNAEDKPE